MELHRNLTVLQLYEHVKFRPQVMESLAQRTRPCLYTPIYDLLDTIERRWVRFVVRLVIAWARPSPRRDRYFRRRLKAAKAADAAEYTE